MCDIKQTTSPSKPIPDTDSDGYWPDFWFPILDVHEFFVDSGLVPLPRIAVLIPKLRASSMGTTISPSLSLSNQIDLRFCAFRTSDQDVSRIRYYSFKRTGISVRSQICLLGITNGFVHHIQTRSRQARQPHSGRRHCHKFCLRSLTRCPIRAMCTHIRNAQ